MLREYQIDVISESLEGLALDSLWSHVGRAHGITSVQVDPDSFEERKMISFFSKEIT